MSSSLFAKRLSWPLQILVWLLAFYVAWNVVPSGFPKLQQDPGLIAYFSSLGLSAGILVLVGVVEVIGSLLLFMPYISFYAAVSVFTVMAAATYYNNWSDPITYVSVIFCLVIAFLSRPGFLRKSLPITKISI